VRASRRPPEYGEYLIHQVFGTLVSNPDVWAKTVLFVVYDENGGALALANPPNTRVPALPKPTLGNTKIAEEAVLNALAGTLDVGIPYPLPTANVMPSQAKTPKRPPVPF
jgi:phospholipase C